MRAILLLAIGLFTVGLCGCAARSVQDLKASPGFHKTELSDFGYQESIKIIKDSYAELLGYDISCTVYSDLKTGECTGTGAPGVYLFISTQYRSDNTANVDFYTAYDTAMWRDTIGRTAKKLRR